MYLEQYKRQSKHSKYVSYVIFLQGKDSAQSLARDSYS